MEGISRINSNVSGVMLASAMLRAHAAVVGNREEKINAGVGIFTQYLDKNGARKEEWERVALLAPEIMIARAGLNDKWLNEAGKALEAATDNAQRQNLLGQIIFPNFRITLFGEAINPGKMFNPNNLTQEVLTGLLCPKMPNLQLNIVVIPEGTFPMGSNLFNNEKFTDNNPYKVKISKFGLGEYEVTNEQYGLGIEQAGLDIPKYWEYTDLKKIYLKNPVVGIDWFQAKAFAEWLGLRLPTEAEWEYAARGANGLTYPWGNEWNPENAVFYGVTTKPVDTYANVRSPFGSKDMSGNVWEWTASWYTPKGYDPEALLDPKGPNIGNSKVIRGGSWGSYSYDYLRGAYRDSIASQFQRDNVGFRVAQDLK